MIDKLVVFHEKHYKKLMFLPIIVFILSLVVLGANYAQTGDFVDRGVSLKGGTSISFLSDVSRDSIIEQMPYNGTFNVRSLSSAGTQIGIIVDLDTTEQEEVDEIVAYLEEVHNAEDLTVEIIGSSLGASFFRQTIIAMIVAFFLMGAVVFAYFRMWIPSIAVVIAAASDIITTLAIIDLFDMKLSSAGIAAFLMLIGYAVDTNILLTTKMLKTKGGTVNERLGSALKTGLMMTLTTIVALIVALVFTQSDVIRQIMIILLVGLVVDVFNTWVQNASVLRWIVQ